jgi:hypothetical protein
LAIYKTTARPATATAAAAKEPIFLEAAPVNLGPFGDVADGETVGAIGDPVDLGPETPPMPVPVLPGAVPVANPAEPPDTPVELEDSSVII